MSASIDRVDEIRIIRPNETARLVGLTNRRLAQLEAEGRFPRRVRLTPRTSGHVASEVDRWLRARVLARDAADAAARAATSSTAA